MPIRPSLLHHRAIPRFPLIVTYNVTPLVNTVMHSKSSIHTTASPLPATLCLGRLDSVSRKLPWRRSYIAICSVLARSPLKAKHKNSSRSFHGGSAEVVRVLPTPRCITSRCASEVRVFARFSRLGLAREVQSVRSATSALCAL